MQSQADHGTRALELMTEALATLDESTLPADIGAHLDMAIVRLRQYVQMPQASPGERAYAVS